MSKQIIYSMHLLQSNESVNLVGALRMDFAIVVLGVHDNDEVRRDVDTPAE